MRSLYKLATPSRFPGSTAVKMAQEQFNQISQKMKSFKEARRKSKIHKNTLRVSTDPSVDQSIAGEER